METVDVVLVSLVMMAGSVLHGSVGLGLGLVAAPFLLIVDPLLIPAPLILNGFVLVLTMALRERRSIDIPQVSWAVAGCIIGTIASVVLLIAIPAEVFSLVFGLMLLAAVGLSLIKWSGLPGGGVVLAAGAASGLMGTTTSIGGPPLALAFQNTTGENLRTTMSVYFVAASIIALIGLAVAGRFGMQELRLAGFLFPGMLSGLLISNYTRHLFRREHVRRIVLLLSTIAAAVIIANYLMGR